MSCAVGIDLYFARVNDFDSHNLSLNPNEKSSLRKFTSLKRQKEWAISKWLRRKVLSEKIGVPEQILVFDTYDSGKPFLSDPVPYFFNISHSHDWIVLAVCRELEVGVDIQKMDEHRNILAIAQHYFSSSEIQELESLDQTKQRELFYTLWTLKEATLKSKGYGIAGNLSQYSFMCDGEKLTLNQGNIEETYLESYQLEQDYLCAVAIDYEALFEISFQIKSYSVRQEEKTISIDLNNNYYKVCN